MKNVQKATVGIVLTSVALIFSIFGLLMTNGTLAWFVGNKDVRADGFGIRIANASNVSATLKSFPVSKISGNSYTFEINGAESYTLPVHDEEQIVPLEYQKALVVEVTVTVIEQIPFTLSLRSLHDVSTLVGQQNWISNCLKIRRATYENGVATTVAVTDPPATTGFITLATTPTKTNEFDLVSQTLSPGSYKYYFVLEYDMNIINYIAGQMQLLYPTIETVEYSNDIEFMLYER
ncbi:MAG: hypothetical protein J6V09_01740 [Clostridia bacterium]|nr:hypothetical protein [Clostridia bacterium]